MRVRQHQRRRMLRQLQPLTIGSDEPGPAAPAAARYALKSYRQAVRQAVQMTVLVLCACGRRLDVVRPLQAGTLREIAEMYGRDWPCDRCGAVWPVDGRAFGLALVRARRTGVVRLPLAGRP